MGQAVRFNSSPVGCGVSASILNACLCPLLVATFVPMPSRTFKRGSSTSDLLLARNFAHLYRVGGHGSKRLFRERFNEVTGFWLRVEVLDLLVLGKPSGATFDAATAIARFFNVPVRSLLFEDLTASGAVFL